MTKPKLTALTTKHQPMPTVPTSTAAIVGPMTRATFTVVVFRVTASRTRSAGSRRRAQMTRTYDVRSPKRSRGLRPEAEGEVMASFEARRSRAPERPGGRPSGPQAGNAVVECVVLAVACLVTYWLATHLLSRVHSVGRDDDLLGGMWAAPSRSCCWAGRLIRTGHGAVAAYSFAAARGERLGDRRIGTSRSLSHPEDFPEEIERFYL